MIPLKKQLEELELEDLTERKPNLIYLKSKQTMKYDITKQTAPQMPTLGNGTECIKILLSQASKDMHEPLVPMLFPVLGAHMSGAEFHDNSHFGGEIVLQWGIGWPKMGVRRWKLSAEEFLNRT